MDPNTSARPHLHGETPRKKIGKVEIVELKEKDGTTKRKFVAFFSGEDKALVLNKTNAQRLAQVFGKDRAEWIGAGVELYSENDVTRKRGRSVAAVKTKLGCQTRC